MIRSCNLTGAAPDPSQKTIAGAKITLLSAATRIQHSTISNTAGIYSITALPVDEYTYRVADPEAETLALQLKDRFDLMVNART